MGQRRTGAVDMRKGNGRTRAGGNVLGAIAVGVMVASVVVAAPAQSVTPAEGTVRSAQSPPQVRGQSYDSQLLALINRARKSRGIKPLKTTPKLAKAGRKWSGRLAASGNLRHDPGLFGSVSRAAGCSRVTAWGENVAYTSGSAASMFAMYMNSPGHRANILARSFTHVGVGSVNGSASWGTVHWNTMKFVRGRCR